MSDGANEPVAVMILDREFFVACTPEEKPGLVAAARYLDEKMREMRAAARGVGMDRVAILAALNISHELLGERERGSDESRKLAEKLQALDSKLDGVFGASVQ
ncbi:MAG TPA: cell division protein ZapA [Dokdonella sp.]